MNAENKRRPNFERQTMNLWPQFGQTIGLGRNSTYAAAARGDFKTIKIGGRILVPRAEVDRLLSQRTAA
jgi:predicted DNA-binding transcriptional regulator AlpA